MAILTKYPLSAFMAISAGVIFGVAMGCFLVAL